MEWYNILVIILGGFGGISGLISLYHAKSNKDTIDIKNLHNIIEDERKEREALANEYYRYRQFVDQKVASVKKDFEELKAENKRMIKSIYQAYRCKYPENIHDCPVVKTFEENKICEECSSNKNQ